MKRHESSKNHGFLQNLNSRTQYKLKGSREDIETFTYLFASVSALMVLVSWNWNHSRGLKQEKNQVEELSTILEITEGMD